MLAGICALLWASWTRARVVRVADDWLPIGVGQSWDSPAAPPNRALVVVLALHGLANRMRSLAWATMAAHLSRRSVVVAWIPSRSSNATESDLFEALPRWTGQPCSLCAFAGDPTISTATHAHVNARRWLTNETEPASATLPIPLPLRVSSFVSAQSWARLVAHSLRPITWALPPSKSGDRPVGDALVVFLTAAARIPALGSDAAFRLRRWVYRSLLWPATKTSIRARACQRAGLPAQRCADTTRDDDRHINRYSKTPPRARGLVAIHLRVSDPAHDWPTVAHPDDPASSALTFDDVSPPERLLAIGIGVAHALRPQQLPPHHHAHLMPQSSSSPSSLVLLVSNAVQVHARAHATAAAAGVHIVGPAHDATLAATGAQFVARSDAESVATALAEWWSTSVAEAIVGSHLSSFSEEAAVAGGAIRMTILGSNVLVMNPDDGLPCDTPLHTDPAWAGLVERLHAQLGPRLGAPLATARADADPDRRPDASTSLDAPSCLLLVACNEPLEATLGLRGWTVLAVHERHGCAAGT